jgi:hypothetical protein
LPQIGGDHEEGFLDTGNELPGWDDRVYVSIVAVREMAKRIQWVPPEEHAEAQAKVGALELEVERLTEELNASESVFDAIDLLESQGYRARKRPGRPKKQEVKEAA